MGPLPPGRAIHFARQVCDCLEEAHAAGIIHRDVKPSNLFVTRVGGDPDFLKLLDFGVARLRQSNADDVRLTRTGTLCGTPAYLAPEIWEGKEADERSDLYAVGVTLYFLLTGQVPYEGTTPVGVMMAQLERDAPPPSVRAGEPLPAGLDSVVLRAMAKRPLDRYRSAAELRQALDAVRAVWSTADAESFWRQAQWEPAGHTGDISAALPTAPAPG